MKNLFRMLLLAAFFAASTCLCFACTEKEDNPKIENTDTTTSPSDTTAQPKPDSITNNNPSLIFVGTYTSGSSVGIYEYGFDTISGKLTLKGSTTSANPSYLTIHPNRKWLYAVNENAPGTVTAYAIDTATHTLTLLNSRPSEGNAPCYVSIDNAGKNALVANYSSGTIATFPIGTDGKLAVVASVVQHTGKGPNSARQEGPHAHMIAQRLGSGLVYASDLGIDKLKAYEMNATTGVLSETPYNVSVAPGYGPRHFAFHPNNMFLYSITELKGTVEVFSYSSGTKELTLVQSISTLPAGTTNEAASADIHITPNGKYLYASNRGTNNNIAMYAVDAVTGKLTLIGHQPTKGQTPRNFCIHPSGKWLLVANQNSSKIVVFGIDAASGKLVDAGVSVSVPNPVCIKFW